MFVVCVREGERELVLPGFLSVSACCQAKMEAG